jgi:hypothetical protein
MRHGRRVSHKLAIFLLAVAIIVPTQVMAAPATSTSAAAKSFSKTVAPVITGTARVNFVLGATVKAWSPGRTSTTYQWKRNGTPIPGARSARYTVTSADVSKTITVTVVGARSGYKSLAVTSAKTKLVAFKNCTELNKVYRHGVGRTGAVDNAKKKVTAFTRNTAIYTANTISDRDKDGIACEK